MKAFKMTLVAALTAATSAGAFAATTPSLQGLDSRLGKAEGTIVGHSTQLAHNMVEISKLKQVNEAQNIHIVDNEGHIAQLQQSVAAIEGATNHQAQAMLQTQSRTKALETELQGNSQDIKAARLSLDALSRESDNQQDQLDVQQQMIDQNYDHLELTKDVLLVLTDDSDKAKAQLAAHEQQIAAQRQGITENADHALANKASILQTNAQVVALGDQVEDNANHALDNKASILATNSQVKALSGQVEENANHALDNKASILQTNAQVTALGSQVEENANHALDNKASIEQIKAVEQQEITQVNDNTQHIQQDEKQISTNSAELKSHEKRLAQDEAYQRNTRSVVSANSDAIAQNSADIAELRNDLNEMAKNVDGAYAESAAFAGLVDPYGVGNIAATAALGYHGDAEAIAIGVGSRFTENFTGKLGGAYDTATEKVSAYVGVGYEF